MNDNWYKLDNVAKLFLADHTKQNPKSIRVSCILKEDVIPELLQQAVDITIAHLPQFQVRIRRGFFWHYLETTNERPIVTLEDCTPCPILYGNSYRGILHYKITYYGKRINIDMFHAISDGTGALMFLKHLVFHYLKLVHPDMPDVSLDEGASSDERYRNSYEHFYDDSDGPVPKTILNKKKKAYHIQGHKLPFNQLQFFEIHMEADKLIKSAKTLNVSLTSYLGAQLMLAIHEDMPFIQRRKPVTVSLPVNLRNYFHSDTLRNFFNNVDVSHVFSEKTTLEELAKEFDQKLKSAIEPEKIYAQMNRYQSIEKLLFTRMVPLAIKQPVVKYFARKEAKRVTGVLSNLGSIQIPDEMKPYVDGFTDYCSTDQLFITVTSYGNDIVLGVTSAFSGTGVIKNLVKALQATETSVKLYASEVTR